MTRTSYGEGKCQQAWALVAALLKARNSSLGNRFTRNDTEFTYQNWGNTEELPSIRVQSTLADLSELSGLSTEQVRETINEHLSSKFLGILENRRSPGRGRGADLWTFELLLWSISIDENHAEFEKFWEFSKQNKIGFRSYVLGKTVQLKSELEDREIDRKGQLVIVSGLDNFLEPYGKFIDNLIGRVSKEFLSCENKRPDDVFIKDTLLRVIQSCSDAGACFSWIYNKRDKSWVSSAYAGKNSSIYSSILRHEILPKVSEHEIFGNESHGRIIESNEKIHVLIPLEKYSSISSKEESVFIAMCDIERSSLWVREPAGKIISTLYKLDLDDLKSPSALKSNMLDALKEAFNFVPLSMYNTRFDLFCESLKTMVVYFQPIVQLLDRDSICLSGWEALARDPLTKRAPIELFKAAELWGVKFMTELDLHFLRTSVHIYCEQRKQINMKRPNDALPLSVNVYPDSLMRNVYLEAVRDLIKRKKILPEKLVLEISEKSALPQPVYWNSKKPTWDSFRRRLGDYVRKGAKVRFAIDDFGVGHASISRLIGLNLEYVKIDREILGYEPEVRDQIISFVNEALISGGSHVPHIVLEGVDNDYPLDLENILEIGAFIQGYAVDPAMDQIYERLPKHRADHLKEKLAFSS